MRARLLPILLVLAACSCSEDDPPATQPDPPGPASWKAVSSPTDNNLRPVWGTSASNVYAVGDSGIVLHYDGVDWSLASTLTDGRLTDVWASSPSDVYVTSSNDTIYHWNGASWQVAYLPAGGNYFTSVWGSSASDVYVATLDGAVVHFDGLDWEWINDAGDPTSHAKLWGDVGSPSAVYATQGQYIVRFNGSFWQFATPAPTYSRQDLQDPMGGIGGSTWADIYAVGGATVLHFSSAVWDTLITPPLGFTSSQSLFDVWASYNDVWIVGDGGTLLHYDGTLWTLTTAEGAPSLTSVWGSSGTNLYAVGKGGVILHYTNR